MAFNLSFTSFRFLQLRTGYKNSYHDSKDTKITKLLFQTAGN